MKKLETVIGEANQLIRDMTRVIPLYKLLTSRARVHAPGLFKPVIYQTAVPATFLPASAPGVIT